MKRLILSVTAVLLFGFNAYAQRRHSLVLPTSHPTVPLCELARDPALYHGKIVRVVGVANGSTGNTFNLHAVEETDGRCEAKYAASVVLVTRPVGVGQPLEEFFAQASFPFPEHRRMKVEVSGKFDSGAESFRGCFGPRFLIEADAVKRLSPATPLILE